MILQRLAVTLPVITQILTMKYGILIRDSYLIPILLIRFPYITDFGSQNRRQASIRKSRLIAFDSNRIIFDIQNRLKRRYHRPDLQKFLDEMNVTDRKTYYKKSCQALVDLSKNYRQHFSNVLEKTNQNQIFSTAANSHRIHCQYIQKLYKSITSENIEDRVLFQMMNYRNDTIEKDENVFGDKFSLFPAITGLNSSIVAQNVDNTRSLNIYQSNGKAKGYNLSDPKFKKEKYISSNYFPVNKDTINDDKLSRVNTSNSYSSTSKPKYQYHRTEHNIFQKIKIDKLGRLDPKYLLVDEANKFKSDDVKPSSASLSDTNDSLDQLTFAWMTQQLKEQEIKRIEDNITGIDTSPKRDNLSRNSLNTTFIAASDDAIHSKNFVSFDKFYEMYDKYDEWASQQTDKIIDNSTIASKNSYSNNSFSGIVDKEELMADSIDIKTNSSRNTMSNSPIIILKRKHLKLNSDLGTESLTV